MASMLNVQQRKQINETIDLWVATMAMVRTGASKAKDLRDRMKATLMMLPVMKVPKEYVERVARWVETVSLVCIGQPVSKLDAVIVDMQEFKKEVNVR